MIHSVESVPVALTYDDVLLVPRRTRVRSRSDVDVSTRLSRRLSLRIPLLAANVASCTEAPMAIALARLGGIGFVHRMNTVEEEAAHVEAVKRASVDERENGAASLDARGRLLVGAAVGVINDHEARAEALVRAGVDVLVVDVAHGHADYVMETVALFKQRYPEVDIVAGNVATAEGTRDLIEAGADAVKVGIGPGGVCTTRLVAGAGVPQLTAVIHCAAAARESGVPIIADGGIRQPGDVAKAIAAGASTVMVATLLAGADESAAIPVERNGERFRVTTGEVTLGVKLFLRRLEGGEVTADEVAAYTPEGVEATYPATGPVAHTVSRLIGGLRSGMSYSGAMSIPEFWEKAEICRVTPAGLQENAPHVRANGAPQLQPDYGKVLVR